jgi:predicted ATPase with chaperone activity
VRAALVASGLALPARRITVNLAPANLPKEGSHYDLPIALSLMAAIGTIPADALSGFTVLGEGTPSARSTTREAGSITSRTRRISASNSRPR